MPAGKVAVTSEAMPFDSGAVPRVAGPSKKVTVPSPFGEVTVAVNVTLAPTVTEDGEAASVIEL